MARRMFLIAVCAGMLAAGTQSMAAGGDQGQQPATGLTLITGDTVIVGGQGRVAIRPAKGRERVKFRLYSDRDHTYVVPLDAVGALAAGRLDRRLFDVDELAASARFQRGGVNLIVRHRPGVRATGLAGTVTQDLPGLDAAAVRVPVASAPEAWRAIAEPRSTIEKVWLDGVRRPTLDVSVPQIGAPAAHRAGLTGAGTTVAVLDTGIDANHPDLAGQVEAARNFVDQDDRDTVGHGTHVASTIAGTGAASGGRYRGVAFGAKLLDGKVCIDLGCPESAILAGMHWAAAERGADVVNLSLGGPDTAEVDLLEEAVNRLTAQHGTLFVIAAGNSGPRAETVQSPGSADAALTVGAVTKQDELAGFSSRGPRVGDAAIKPDVTAPGVDVVAARSADAFGDAPGRYVTLSGTSMAAPHVAGAAAILAQQHPDWTAGRLKAALMASARPAAGPTTFQQGAGRIDVAVAVGQRVLATPPSFSLGRQRWPHDDDRPLGALVLLTNAGAEPVTLPLRLDVTGPDGRPAPAGMFTLSATEITVPPGGEASVRITADTTVAGPDGHYAGALVGGDAVRVPVAVDKEVESYDLVVDILDRDGEPAAFSTSVIVGVDNDVAVLSFGAGALRLRLPRGVYHLDSAITPPPEETGDATLLVRPAVILDRDTTLTDDARLGRPIQVTVPHASARPALAIAEYTREWPGGWMRNGLFGADLGRIFTAHLGPTLPRDELTASVTTQWAEPDGNGWFDNSPYLYSTMHFQHGRMFTGFEHAVRRSELATVHREYLAQAPGRTSVVGVYGMSADGRVRGSTVGPAFLAGPLPARRTEYHTAGALWAAELLVVNGDQIEASQGSGLIGYRAGRRYVERLNRPVFGPAFPPAPWNWVSRAGDTLSVGVSLFGGGPGHFGHSVVDDARTTLYRDGAKIAETGSVGFQEFGLPPQPARYRLEVQARRGSAFELSTRVSAAWTFRSEHEPDADVLGEPLPLMAVRFAPQLDGAGSAPGGRAFPVPVSVQRQAGAPAARVRELRVEASYDDGLTWLPVRLVCYGGGVVALLAHPAGPGFVSLRASATDADGNSVQQTILRAYRLR